MDEDRKARVNESQAREKRTKEAAARRQKKLGQAARFVLSVFSVVLCCGRREKLGKNPWIWLCL